MPFKGLLLQKSETGFSAQLKPLNESDLPPGEVLIRVSHSSLNYKDALGIHNRAPVIRKFPMVAGIDLAGTVETSSDSRWKRGDPVLVTGFGIGELRWGGLAELCRVPADFPVRLPEGLSAAMAMSIGTAGLTAMLCVNAMERAGLRADLGEVLVTGASGGVGSMAIHLLARLRYRVIACTGRTSEVGYLKSLGAAEIIDRSKLSSPGKPLQREQWIAAVDTVGSHTLANVCAGIRERGWVTTCGMAQGLDLPATVAPFILRGISLIGIASSTTPMTDRLEAWRRLANLVEPERLAQMTHTIRLEDAIQASGELLAGKVRGRLLVQVND